MTHERIALVTGVSSGIGRAIAARVSGRGFRVFGTMRRLGETDGRSGDAEPVPLDVRDEGSVRSCVRTVLDRAGRIDALVNNAGYMLVGALEETGLNEAREVFEMNFFGVLRMSQAVLPIMREQGHGRIANIGSVVGFMPDPYQGIYAASKHALEGYSESLDHEVRRFGIRVSVIEPGFTRTDLGRNARLAGQPLAAYDGERNAFSEPSGKASQMARTRSEQRRRFWRRLRVLLRDCGIRRGVGPHPLAACGNLPLPGFSTRAFANGSDVHIGET